MEYRKPKIICWGETVAAIQGGKVYGPLLNDEIPQRRTIASY